MTTAGFGADVYLFIIVGLVFWLLLPTLLLGWSPVMIASGSMSPAIRAGDIVLINEQVAAEPFGAGTIITYTDPRQDRDRLVTHRIAETELTPEAAAVAEYITRGDANTVNDAHPVIHDQVVGSARLLIPLLGLPVHWARTPDHTSLSIFVLLTMTAVAVATGTARQTAVSVRPSRQQLRRNSRSAQRDRAVISARASRAAQAAQAVRAAQAAGSVPDGTDARLDVAAATIPTSSPATDAAPPVQRGVGAASGPGPDVGGGSGTNVDPTATAAPGDVNKLRLRPVAQLRAPARRSRERQPSRLFMFVLLIAITAGGASIPGTGAAFTAAAINTGNMFSTAAPAPDPGPPPDLVLPPFEGAPIVDSTGNPPGQYTTFPFDVQLDQAVVLNGTAIAELRVRRNGPGNSPGDAEVRLYANGTQIAAGTSDNVTGDGWQTISIPLSPALDATYEAGTEFTVEVDIRRLAMDLSDGQSKILLPHAS